MSSLCSVYQEGTRALGGVSAEKDIAALKALGKKNLVGVIVGKALYEGKIDLRKNKTMS